MKVLHQGDMQWADSQKAEGGKIAKCSIVLQRVGNKFEDMFSATLLGDAAQCRFTPGDVVAVGLRFTVREHEGMSYQSVTVNEIFKIR